MRRVVITLSLIACLSKAYAQSPGGVSTNLRLWLKANTGLTLSPATQVQTWADQSGNSLNATQATVSLRPLQITNRVNFNPTVQFDGADDYLSIATGIVGTATYNNFNVFAVTRTNVISSSSIFYEDQSGGGRINAHAPWSDNVFYWDAGSASGSQRLSTGWASSTGVNYLWSLTSSTTATPSGLRQDIYRNGAILANDNNMSSFTGNNSAMIVGAFATSSGFYNGEIAELIMYNGALTAATFQRINSYLALKYGITLDQTIAQNYVASNGTVIWNGTTSSGYKNNIAGIGRDNGAGGSALDQPKSASVNSPSDIIVMANSDFASPTTMSANLQFLLWGHNGQVISADPSASAVTHGGASIQAYLKRIWSTTKTGSPTGNVIVEVNMDLIQGPSGLGTNTNADLRLLIDGDATFGNNLPGASESSISPTAGFAVTGGKVYFTVPYSSIVSSQGFFGLGSVNKTTCPISLQQPGGPNATIKLWLKANAGVVGSPVSQWSDQSGNGYLATQSVVGNRPSFLSNRINFNPAVQFSNVSSQNLFITGGVMGSSTYNDFNVFAVARTNTVVASSIFYEDQASAGRVNVHIPWSDNVAYWDAGSAGGTQRLSVAWGGTINTNYLWSFTSSTTSTQSGLRQDIYRNGLLLANDNTMSSFTGNGSNMTIGSLAGGSFFNGEIAEMIMYTNNMTLPQFQVIQSHLASKYGITLDQSSPQSYYASDWNGSTGTLIWNASAAGVYNRDITVIGRDDNSTLNQKQSGSVNANNNIFIGNVALATDNATNSNNFSTDKSFFSWGHNGQAMDALGVTDLPTGGVAVLSRLARIWRAQETGTVGSLRIRFDMSNVPGVGGVPGANNLNNVRLIVSTTATFATGTTNRISPASVAGNLVEFDFDFTAGTGFFFTVGSVNLTTTPLPIELASFSATPKGNTVLVNWSTASELNNSHFQVESSEDAEKWKMVERVNGKGTTTVTSRYSITDVNPIIGVSYYRLRQVDFDGTQSLSKVVKVELAGEPFNLYPNPASSTVTLDFVSKGGRSAVMVTSLQGLPMLQREFDSSNKRQLIELDISSIPSGIYLVTVYVGDVKSTKKLVVH